MPRMSKQQHESFEKGFKLGRIEGNISGKIEAESADKLQNQASAREALESMTKAMDSLTKVAKALSSTAYSIQRVLLKDSPKGW